MLRLRCSTAVVVLAWASALHAADPLPLEPAAAPAPAPGAPRATVESAAFPPIDPLPAPPPELQAAPTGALAPPAAEAPKAEKPSPPDRLSVNKYGGFFQPSALIQMWGQVTHVDKQKTSTGFRLRRAELRAKGEILPKFLSYFINFDVAKTPTFTTTTAPVQVTAADGGASPGTVAVPTSTLGADRSVLQDVYMTYISDYADVSIGQFKIPVSLEALQSAGKLLFTERSKVTREYGDRRDVGIRIDKKIEDVFYYNIGLFNGNGQNAVDNDRAKDLALRLEAYPIPGLTIGGLAYGTVGALAVDTVRNRVEGDVRLDLADLIVQGEYIHGWTGPKARRLEGHGAYGAVGYTIAQQFQPVARLGILDINIDRKIAPKTEPESGPQRQFEFALNYLLKSYDAKITADIAYYSQVHGVDTTEFTLQTQATF